jgi:hypothetical protein
MKDYCCLILKHPINGNMNVSQIYSLGVSKTTAGKVVVGLQDNGSWFVNGFINRFNGGDGMEYL